MALNPVKPLYSASATATNGSTTIQVTGNVNCSFLASGAIVSLGTRQLVDAVSGTAPDLSGNSTITLRRAWADPTTTAPLLVFMSYEGLADAVIRLRQIIDASEGSLEGSLSYLGAWDASSNTLPTPPGEGLGTVLYDISVAGTVEGVSYKVGDFIIYDQFTSTWKNWNSQLDTRLGTSGNLGNAATKTVTTSSTDLTAGRLLQFGDFGLGEAIDYPQGTVNNLKYTATYKVASAEAAADGFPFTQGGILRVYGDSGTTYAIQEYSIFVGTTPRKAIRHFDNGTWRAWFEVVKVGDYGLGVAIVSTADLNTLVSPGLYSIASTNANNPLASLALLDVMVTSGGRVIQTVWRTSSAAGVVKLTRNYNASVWSNWTAEYHQENILGTVAQSGGVPTGAIIQRGSNANGEFTRYADGTVDYWTSIVQATDINVTTSVVTGQFRSPTQTKSIPTALISNTTHEVSITNMFVSGQSLIGYGFTLIGKATTSFTYSASSTTSQTGVTLNASVVGKGRWF